MHQETTLGVTLRYEIKVRQERLRRIRDARARRAAAAAQTGKHARPDAMLSRAETKNRHDIRAFRKQLARLGQGG